MREEIIALFLFPFLLHGTGGSANKGGTVWRRDCPVWRTHIELIDKKHRAVLTTHPADFFLK